MSDEAKDQMIDPSPVGGPGHRDRLAELKRRLWGDFGKTTCWQWLCKERDARTEPEQIAVAEEVLAMPRMGNVAAAQTYWLRLQGRKTFTVDEMVGDDRT